MSVNQDTSEVWNGYPFKQRHSGKRLWLNLRTPWFHAQGLT